MRLDLASSNLQVASLDLALLARGLARADSSSSALGCVQGAALSVLAFADLGPSLSTQSFARLGPAAFALDFASIGPVILVQSFACCGSQLFFLGAGCMELPSAVSSHSSPELFLSTHSPSHPDSSLPMLSLSLDPSSPPKASTRLGLPTSAPGASGIGAGSPALDVTTPGSSLFAHAFKACLLSALTLAHPGAPPLLRALFRLGSLVLSFSGRMESLVFVSSGLLGPSSFSRSSGHLEPPTLACAAVLGSSLLPRSVVQLDPTSPVGSASFDASSIPVLSFVSLDSSLPARSSKCCDLPLLVLGASRLGSTSTLRSFHQSGFLVLLSESLRPEPSSTILGDLMLGAPSPPKASAQWDPLLSAADLGLVDLALPARRPARLGLGLLVHGGKLGLTPPVMDFVGLEASLASRSPSCLHSLSIVSFTQLDFPPLIRNVGLLGEALALCRNAQLDLFPSALALGQAGSSTPSQGHKRPELVVFVLSAASFESFMSPQGPLRLDNSSPVMKLCSVDLPPSALDCVSCGFSLLARDPARADGPLDLAGVLAVESLSRLPVCDHVTVGPCLPLRSHARPGVPLSTADFATLDFSVPIRWPGQLDFPTTVPGASHLGAPPTASGSMCSGSFASAQSLGWPGSSTSTPGASLGFIASMQNMARLEPLASSSCARGSPLLMIAPAQLDASAPLQAWLHLDPSVSASHTQLGVPSPSHAMRLELPTSVAQRIPSDSTSPVSDLAFLAPLASPKGLPWTGSPASAPDFSNLDPSLLPRGPQWCGALVPVIAAMRMAPELPVCESFRLGLVLPVRSLLWMGLLAMILDTGHLASSPSLQHLAYAGPALSAAAAQAGMMAPVLDFVAMGSSLPIRSSSRSSLALLVPASASAGSLTSVRGLHRTGTGLPVRNGCCVEAFLLVLGDASLDFSLSVRSFGRGSPLSALDLVHPGAPAPLHSASRLGSPPLAPAASRTGFSLLVAGYLVASSPSPRSSSHPEPSTTSLGLARTASVSSPPVPSLSSLGPSAPPRSLSYMGPSPPAMSVCLGFSSSLQSRACLGLTMLTYGCRGASLPVCDLILGPSPPLRALSRPGSATSTSQASHPEASLPLRALARPGVSSSIPSASAASALLADYVEFGSSPLPQGLARSASSTFTSDATQLDSCSSSRCLARGASMLVLGISHADVLLLALDCSTLGSFSLLRGVCGLGLKLLVPGFAMTGLASSSHGFAHADSLMVVGSACLGLSLLISDAMSVGFSLLLRSFIRLGLSLLLMHCGLEPSPSLRSALHLGASLLPSGFQARGLSVLGASRLGLPLPTRSYACLEAPMLACDLSHAGLSLLPRACGRLGPPIIPTGRVLGHFLSLVALTSSGLSLSPRSAARLEPVPLVQDFSNCGPSLFLQAFGLGSPIFTVGRMSLGLPLSAVGIAYCGSSLPLRSLYQLGSSILVLSSLAVGSSSFARGAACLDALMPVAGTAGPGCLHSLSAFDCANLGVLLPPQSFAHSESSSFAGALAQLGLSMPLRNPCRLDFALFVPTCFDATTSCLGSVHLDLLASVQSSGHMGPLSPATALTLGSTVPPKALA